MVCRFVRLRKGVTMQLRRHRRSTDARNRTVTRQEKGRFFLNICKGFYFLSRSLWLITLVLPYFLNVL